MTIRSWVVFFLLVLNAFAPPGLVTCACILCMIWLMIFGQCAFRIPFHLLRWLLLPTAIVAVAALGALQNAPSDAFKDAWYLLSPVVTLATGYMICRENDRTDDILSAFVVAGLVLSIAYIFIYVYHLSWTLGSVEEIRRKNGDAFVVSFIAPVILMISRIYRYRIAWLDRQRLLARVTLLFCLIALALSMSRTWWVCLIAAVFIASRISAKKKALIFVLSCGLVLGASLIFGDSSTSSSGDAQNATMRDKIVGSLQEMAIRDYTEMNDIEANWRGFESFVALSAYASGTPYNWVFGFGLGKVVDLGFYMALGNDGIRYIPIMHNGYVYILIKTGVVGLVVYLWFFFRLYRSGKSYRASATSRLALFGTLQCVLSVVIVLTTFVITGMYNKNELFSSVLILGVSLAACRDNLSETLSVPVPTE